MPIFTRRVWLVRKQTNLANDSFRTILPAGSLNNTPADWQGFRTVTDTEGTHVSITNAGLFFNGAKASPAYGDPGYWLNPSFVRQYGRVGMIGINKGATTLQWIIGWGDLKSGVIRGSGYHINGLGMYNYENAGAANYLIKNLTADTDYIITTILRSVGGFSFIKGGDITRHTLLNRGNLDTRSPLFLGVAGYNNVAPVYKVRIPKTIYFVRPFASDSFIRSNGALGVTDGEGHLEKDGGNGKAWIAQVGTWAISANTAIASALSGGIAVALINHGTPDIYAEVNITLNGGTCGFVLRYADSQNYLLLRITATQILLDKVVAGVTTNLFTTAISYAAGAVLKVSTTGSILRGTYKDTGSAVTNFNAALPASTATNHGLYTTDITNSFTNFIGWQAGSEGQHDYLDELYRNDDL